MNEILEYLNKQGFNPPSLDLDGKVHRFDHIGKKDGWYIGFQNFSNKDGSPFYIVKFGSWKSSEDYEFKSARKYTKEEKKQLDQQIKKASKVRAAEKAVIQEETSKKAQFILDNIGSENDNCDYLERKKIPHLFGTLSTFTNSGRGLLVPCRDINNKLWGLQTIYPDGSKFFMEGQKISGCFHLIGEWNGDTVYLCEGFSTGTSIFQATANVVACCFNASNLIQVARDIRKNRPQLSIVICGDDDKFNDQNTGRIKAEEAAKICLGSVVFPTFKNKEKKLNDFNDVHIEEGLDEVRTQITKIKKIKNYVKCLGHKEDFYYYTSSSNKQIFRLSVAGHTKNALLNLMPNSYWNTLYPSKDGFDLIDAIDDLMANCRQLGIFNESKIRGAGAWKDNNRIVINVGDSLWFDNKKNNIHSIRSKYIYKIGSSFDPPEKKPLKTKECQVLLEALHTLKWVKPDYVKFLAGWLVIAPICGALDWRPHLWLTGPSGTGKSFIIENLVGPIVDKYGLRCVGQTTEAGIRQDLGCDSRAVVFDEFETNDERSAQRVASIVELIRQASSDSKAHVIKGSAGGNAIKYHPRFSALVSSVRVNLTFEADVNRFAIVELTRGGGPEQFEKVEAAFAKITEDFIDRLFSRAVSLFDVLEANRKLFWKVLSDKYEARFGQQYGTLLAGYALLESDRVLSIEEVEFICDTTDFKETRLELEESDEGDCLTFLLDKVITVDAPQGRSENSISSMVEASARNLPDDLSFVNLRKIGIIVRDNNLFVANKHPSLSQIFKGTKWCNGWSKSLARVKGAEKKPIMHFGKYNKHRCVRIPIASL